MTNTKQNTRIVLFRHNTVAIIATALDYTLFIFFSEVLQFWYLLASFTGLVMGGITAFVLERNWTFKKKNGNLSAHAIRYLMVWATSIFLNTAGLYLVVEYIGIQYIISKIIVSIVVGIGFNFLMYKYFVFK
jgi:putative flippase GtrA